MIKLIRYMKGREWLFFLVSLYVRIMSRKQF